MDKELLADLHGRHEKIRQAMREAGADACLLTDNMNMFYAAGQVVNAYFYLPVEGEPRLFVKRPNNVRGENVVQVTKPEQIREIFEKEGVRMPAKIMLEADELSYSEYVRLQAVFAPAETGNATAMMRKVRSVKTPWEITQLRRSADVHTEVYNMIPSLYRPGMTDMQLQHAIERVMRDKGSIGLFRAFGPKMECFMGTVLVGDNAAEPSPFDYALGGKGTPSSPVGACGCVITPGTTVTVDMAGNYTEYITDMTRVFSLGQLPEIAHRAHRVSMDIEDAVMDMARPGTPCADIYNLALAMAKKAGLASCFMGTVQQAKFVGHGIGLQINEMPVLAPRSKDVLQEGVVFALEPKFVIDGVGAAGVEDSFLVTATGVERLTGSPREILPLE